MRVAYFGPAGTHTHVAARSAFPNAEERDLPLLFKGGDFARTDVRSAM